MSHSPGSPLLLNECLAGRVAAGGEGTVAVCRLLAGEGRQDGQVTHWVAAWHGMRKQACVCVCVRVCVYVRTDLLTYLHNERATHTSPHNKHIMTDKVRTSRTDACHHSRSAPTCLPACACVHGRWRCGAACDATASCCGDVMMWDDGFLDACVCACRVMRSGAPGGSLFSPLLCSIQEDLPGLILCLPVWCE